MPRKEFDAPFERIYEPDEDRMRLALEIALGLKNPEVCDRELAMIKAKKGEKAGAA